MKNRIRRLRSYGLIDSFIETNFLKKKYFCLLVFIIGTIQVEAYDYDTYKFPSIKSLNNRVKGNTSLSSNFPTFQQNSITGTVLDEFNIPLAGAAVIIKGTTTGTVTDFDGNFSINPVEPSTVLVVSYIGYKEKELKVGNQKQLNIILESDAVGLEEVIAVGYSTRKKSEISSAVVNIGEEDLQTSSNPDVETLLQGKIAGVQVFSDQQSSGESANIRIRGSGSISANSSPLFVVDGIIGGSFDPNDVADITVLKDAGATGLYGSRAAGGVIVVTTKKGKSGDTKIRLTTQNGGTMPNWGNFEFLDGSELLDLYKQGFSNGGFSDEEFNALFPENVRNTNFNWNDFLYANGSVSTTNLSVSGGNEKTTFYVSGNYQFEDGVLRNDKYSRASTTLNFSHKISDKLSFQLNTYARLVENDRNTGFTVYNVPFDTPYDENGVVRSNEWVKNNYITQERINHALPEENGDFDNFKVLTLNPSLKLDYRPLDWLTLSGSARVNYQTNKRELFKAEESGTTAFPGELRNNLLERTDVLTNAIARVYKGFGNHSITALAGAEFNQIDNKYFEAFGTGIPDGAYVLDVAATPQAVDGNSQRTTYNSYFSQLDYSYNSKYFLTASYRTDGSSRFGADNRFGNFWSVAGSYMLSEEDFIKEGDLFQLLKLRASYGLTGNAGLDDYAHLSTYSFSAAYLGENALTPQTLGNNSLTWEIARQLNVGFDASLFNSRANISFDYYYTKNSDLLFRVPLPSELGFSDQWRNVGQLDNWGYEVSLDFLPVKTEDFSWNSNFQLGFNKNEIKELNGDAIDKDGDGYFDNSVINNNQILQVGGARNQFYGREWFGADPATGDARWISSYNSDGTPILTDNIQEGRFITSKGIPDFIGGFTNDLKYKGFNFETIFSYGFGNYTVVRDFEYDNDGNRTFRPELKVYGDAKRWEQPGDVASRPRFVYQNNSAGSSFSSRYWENGNFVKLAALTLGYSFEKKALDQIGLGSLRIFARGENLKVWHKTSGITPELAGFDANSPERNQRPTVSKVVLGLDITF